MGVAKGEGLLPIAAPGKTDEDTEMVYSLHASLMVQGKRVRYMWGWAHNKPDIFVGEAKHFALVGFGFALVADLDALMVFPSAEKASEIGKLWLSWQPMPSTGKHRVVTPRVWLRARRKFQA